ncbi:MAG: cytochrome c [Gemmatimonadetes bacterium]|nr:cytochrome c [Gemmatimonadota bacterium]
MRVAAIALGVLAAGCASAASGLSGADGGPAADTSRGAASARTVLAGVYTGEQATRGQQDFQQSCASCHAVSEFSGPIFQRIWAGRAVGEMYEFVSTMMPDGDPGGLTPQEYADILAYFLRQNQYPTGGAELPADAAALRGILFPGPAR